MVVSRESLYHLILTQSSLSREELLIFILDDFYKSELEDLWRSLPKRDNLQTNVIKTTTAVVREVMPDIDTLNSINQKIKKIKR